MNARQEIFIEEYIRTWNGSEAARRANYANPNVQASRLLANDNIREKISERMREIAMDTNEVLARLAEQARVSIADFVSEREEIILDKEGNPTNVKVISLNWDVIKENGHLVKSIVPTAAGIRLELHDAQTALIQIGKANGALTERIDATVITATVTPSELQKARERAKTFEEESGMDE